MNPNEGLEDLVRKRISKTLSVKEALLSDIKGITVIAKVGSAIAEALRGGHTILIFGNGGSAADAQHIAAEFVGRYTSERAPMPALALTVNTSALTAIGNDYSFDKVFSRQIEAFGHPGDVAIGISTSGNSGNVLLGLAAASVRRLTTVGLTGKSGGKMRDACDYCVCVPADSTPLIQEVHGLVGHILCEIVERDLCDS